MPQTNWENLYPLNTFEGETKRELIKLIASQRQAAVEEKLREIEEKMPKLEEPDREYHDNCEECGTCAQWLLYQEFKSLLKTMRKV